jgi:beta-mannosidase
VYTVVVSSAAITYLVPHTFYNGSYPVTPLSDGNHGDFIVKGALEYEPWFQCGVGVVVTRVVRYAVPAVRTHFWAPTATKGTLIVKGAWSGQSAVSVPVTLRSGDSNVTVTLVADQSSGISLWWPVGLGGHSLYNVTAAFQPSAGGDTVATTRAIGFRFVALVTGNDTDPGTGGLVVSLLLLRKPPVAHRCTGWQSTSPRT